MYKLALILLFFSNMLFAQDADYSKIPQLQTRATFTTQVVPDKVTFSVLLSEEDSNGKISLETLEQRFKEVLRDNGVNVEEQLQLVDLSSDYKEYFLKKDDVIKAKNFHLVLFNAASAGVILKQLAEQRIANVKLLKSEYSKLEELKIDLRAKAIEKAERQAQQMFEPLGQKLGKAIFISDLETSVDNLFKPRDSGLNMVSNLFLLDEQVDFKSIRVDATVTVYFSLD